MGSVTLSVGGGGREASSHRGLFIYFSGGGGGAGRGGLGGRGGRVEVVIKIKKRFERSSYQSRWALGEING